MQKMQSGNWLWILLIKQFEKKFLKKGPSFGQGIREIRFYFRMESMKPANSITEISPERSLSALLKKVSM